MAGKGLTFTTTASHELYYEVFHAAVDEPELDIIFFHGVNESADTTGVQNLAKNFTAAGLP